MRFRVVLSGSSDTDNPLHYHVYSGLGLEAALVRDFGRSASIELALRTESREVTGPDGSTGSSGLGSLEVLPITLLAQWRPRGEGAASFQPYLGLGVAASIVWEKSGALDSVDVPIRLGPALQVGADRKLSSNASLNLDVRWNTFAVDLREFDPNSEEVRVDPLALGLGFGFRF